MPKCAKIRPQPFAVVPLDLTVRTASDADAVMAALEGKLYVRTLQVDVRVDFETFMNLQKKWKSSMGEK